MIDQDTGRIDYPGQMTQPCHSFVAEYIHLRTWLQLFIQLPKLFEGGVALLEQNSNSLSEDFRRVQAQLQSYQLTSGKVGGYLQSGTPLQLQMTYSRAVDNYLIYISGLLSLVYRMNPKALSSKETVTLEEVMSFSNMNDLISYLAERRVSKLSYEGLYSLVQYVKKTTGLELFPDGAAFRAAKDIIELRNLIVHNRGVVDHRYKSKGYVKDLSLGSRLMLDADSVFDVLATLAQSAFDIDARAASKFGLPLLRPTQIELHKSTEPELSDEQETAE